MQDGLVGRRGDVDRLVGWITDASSDARALEVIGEPGIGKTALLDATVGAIDGAMVVRTAATAVEQPLTWTGLARLVDGWPAEQVAALSSAQRRALDGALGRIDEPPELGVVAAAVAALVESAAATGSVVIVIDDAHWLDDATAGVVSSALRGNRARPVRLLAARRPAPSPLQPERLVPAESFDRLVLGGLSTAGVHDLLQRAHVELTRPRLVHVHATTGGNALHVLELARLLRSGVAIDDALRQTSLDSVVGQRVRELDAPTQMVLGAAALTASPTVEVLGACLPDVDVMGALASAERAGLVTLADSTVRFIHPTVATAADAALGSVERRRLHVRLADVAAVGERALHLDASFDGPDEKVAAALDAAARDAWERGAIEIASRRMSRAIDRSPATPVDRRWERRVALADMLMDLGAASDAVAALDPSGEPSLPAEVALHARVMRVRAAARFHANDERGAAAEFADLVDMFPAGDPIRVDALLAWARTNLFIDVPASVTVAAQAASEALATGDDHLIGTTAASELASRFLAGEPVQIPLAAPSDSRRLTAAEILDEMLVWVDDLDHAEPRITERLANAEQRGDSATIANVSLTAADLRMRRGDPAGARELYERALELASTMDDHSWIAMSCASLAFIAAHAAAGDDVVQHAQRAVAELPALSPTDRVAVHAALAQAFLLHGDAPTAIEHCWPARTVTLDLGLHDCNAINFRAEMVEALLAVGATAEAREVSDELTRFATTAGRTRGLGDAHRAAALVAAADGDLEAARSCAERAIVEHDRLPGPIEGATSRLVAGMIERRLRKRAVARACFEEALAVFRRVGSVSLTRRAEAELARTGARSEGLDALTPAEEQVARLVALGLTNAEVAAHLHMSAKTVEANLTRIYRKLGVRSRTELAARAPN